MRSIKPGSAKGGCAYFQTVRVATTDFHVRTLPVGPMFVSPTAGHKQDVHRSTEEPNVRLVGVLDAMWRVSPSRSDTSTAIRGPVTCSSPGESRQWRGTKSEPIQSCVCDDVCVCPLVMCGNYCGLISTPLSRRRSCQGAAAMEVKPSCVLRWILEVERAGKES